MALREELEKEGKWLFRWRSYLPSIILFPFIIFELYRQAAVEQNLILLSIWEFGCVLVSFFGLGIRMVTIGFVPKGTSGRNVKEQRADSLNTSGIYSVVRNPLYMGNYFICLGFVAFPMPSFYFPIAFTMLFLLYHERIVFTEEEFLRKKFGQEYLDWTAETPLFIPKFKKWEKPDLSFSLKNAIRREDSSFSSIVGLYCLFSWLQSYFRTGEAMPSKIIVFVFLCGTGIYLIVRFFRKHTKILDLEER